LQKLTSVDLPSMEYYTFQIGEMAGIADVVISATGYTGAGGFEIYVKNADAEKMWDAIFEAGAEFGIKPVGLGARDTLRLEKGFCLYGNDIDDNTSPLEAGLGWVTKFSKDFINSENLKKQKEAGLTKKLVGFEMIDRGIPRGHYELCDADGGKLGEVTSGTQSPTLQKGIGMGYVPTAFSKPDTEIFVKVRDKLLKARTVKLPFVKN
jgi:aminomethyltransferase